MANIKSAMQICSDITPWILPNKLCNNTQRNAAQKAFLLVDIKAVLLYVKKDVMATKAVPARRIAKKLFPKT